jgi:hypothetical protein
MDRRFFFGEDPLSVYLALEETAGHLTSRDLLRILGTTKIADQSGEEVHISPGSWLVLVKVPEIYYPKVADALRSIGFGCDVISGEMNELSTFDLRIRKEGQGDAVSV